jgi:hypothetical protein
MIMGKRHQLPSCILFIICFKFSAEGESPRAESAIPFDNRYTSDLRNRLRENLTGTTRCRANASALWGIRRAACACAIEINPPPPQCLAENSPYSELPSGFSAAKQVINASTGSNGSDLARHEGRK